MPHSRSMATFLLNRERDLLWRTRAVLPQLVGLAATRAPLAFEAGGRGASCRAGSVTQ